MRQVIGALLLALLLAPSVYFLQLQLDHFPMAVTRPETPLYLPAGRYLRPAALGFEQLLADFLWIRTVIYFGQHYLSDKDYRWLYHMVDLVTTLDPKSDMAYRFGGILLALEARRIEESNRIWAKGMANLPEQWYFPFGLGFNYFFFLGNKERAVVYLERAARLPGRAPFLPKWVASLYSQLNRKEVAIQFLRDIYRETDNEWIRNSVRQKLKELES